MGRVEQCVGIGIGGATLSSVFVIAGNYFERKANRLTVQGLEDADLYKSFSEALYFAAPAILFITFIFVSQLARKH